MKRSFKNFAVWNPTFLILKFYSLFGTLDLEEMKKTREYSWFIRDFVIPPEEYIPFLKIDGEIPSMKMMCDMIQPFLHLSNLEDGEERHNADVVAGYALTESVSNLILDYIDRFKELCTSNVDFRNCCSAVWSRLDYFFCEYKDQVYDEGDIRYTRYIDESFLDGDSADDIVTSVYVSGLMLDFTWEFDKKEGYIIKRT